MTLFLASVTTTAEAEIALREGADLIDLKDPSQGAFGALPLSVIKAVVEAVGGRRPVSAVAGELPMEPARLVEAVASLAETGVDYVKVGFRPSPSLPACIEALAPLANKTQLVAAFFADLAPIDFAAGASTAHHGFKAAMLDTAEKGAGRLMTRVSIADMSRFVETCREHGLMSGLAGALETPDIVRLLWLNPGLLGFRGALCQSGKRVAALDPEAVKIVRELIPREVKALESSSGPKIDWRLLTARGYAAPNDKGSETDLIFVHDLVLPVAIGAYDYERGHTQRVRFNVDLDVRRTNALAEDMRDVFSYDVVVDAIKLLLSRGHVALVETLAEQIASVLLAYAAIVRVKIRVEKLDIIEGSVGIEITRERGAVPARVHQFFPGLSDMSGAKAGK